MAAYPQIDKHSFANRVRARAPPHCSRAGAPVQSATDGKREVRLSRTTRSSAPREIRIKCIGAIVVRQSERVAGERQMAEARKARAVGFNHVALEVGDIDEALAFYGRLFDLNYEAKVPLRHSSIWATNSLHSRMAVPNVLTAAVILDLWSTTRMQSAKHWPRRVSNRCPVRSWTFSTRGATA